MEGVELSKEKFTGIAGDASGGHNHGPELARSHWHGDCVSVQLAGVACVH